VALSFGVAVFVYGGTELGIEYFAGYLTEQGARHLDPRHHSRVGRECGYQPTAGRALHPGSIFVTSVAVPTTVNERWRKGLKGDPDVIGPVALARRA
jgi:hypothetical protein